MKKTAIFLCIFMLVFAGISFASDCGPTISGKDCDKMIPKTTTSFAESISGGEVTTGEIKGEFDPWEAWISNAPDYEELYIRALWDCASPLEVCLTICNKNYNIKLMEWLKKMPRPILMDYSIKSWWRKRHEKDCNKKNR